jgi:16S rRNA (guanine1207-N2)-methyltransferase
VHPACIVRRVSPALETLMLPFSQAEIAVPSQALFLGAEPHEALRGWPSVTGWQPLKPLAEAWEKAGFSRVDEPAGTWPLVLLLPGKSKDETLAAFARAHDLLESGGTLVVAMANTAGAPRFEKELEKAAGRLGSLSKHKCRAFHAVKDGTWDAAVLAGWRALGAPRQVDGFTVEAGMFSADHIDPGSALLAAHLPKNLRGSVADLGAGWGYLSKVVADHCPGVKAIHLFEADARALGCARKNLGDGPFEFHWQDVTAGVPGKYEVIVSNPPFHTGQASDLLLGKSFLRAAAAALRTGGRLLLVANRQLPYEPELEALGLVWRKPVEDATYKLLFAEKRMEPAPADKRHRR